jgi:hypothetical protein
MVGGNMDIETLIQILHCGFLDYEDMVERHISEPVKVFTEGIYRITVKFSVIKLLLAGKKRVLRHLPEINVKGVKLSLIQLASYRFSQLTLTCRLRGNDRLISGGVIRHSISPG